MKLTGKIVDIGPTQILGNAKRKHKLIGKNLEKTLKIITKINTELTNEFLVEIYFRNYTDLLETFVNLEQPLIDLERYN